MNYTAADFQAYASSLFRAADFDDAFSQLEAEVIKLGFEGVLYTYIPRVLLDTGFHVNPVYHVSADYNPAYIKHYTEARFERFDPLVKAVQEGVETPISWWGNLCATYMQKEKAAREVIETSRQYGINNGITLPLLTGHAGIAGASFISSEKAPKFDILIGSQLNNLNLCAQLFHNMVLSNAPFRSEFIKPLLETLSRSEISCLIGLATGKSPERIADELGLSSKYLEQVILRLRRKLSGVTEHERPTINRNQLLYYAGLLEIMEHEPAPVAKKQVTAIK